MMEVGSTVGMEVYNGKGLHWRGKNSITKVPVSAAAVPKQVKCKEHSFHMLSWA